MKTCLLYEILAGTCDTPLWDTETIVVFFEKKWSLSGQVDRYFGWLIQLLSWFAWGSSRLMNIIVRDNSDTSSTWPVVFWTLQLTTYQICKDNKISLRVIWKDLWKSIQYNLILPVVPKGVWMKGCGVLLRCHQPKRLEVTGDERLMTWSWITEAWGD